MRGIAVGVLIGSVIWIGIIAVLVWLGREVWSQ